MFNLNEQTFKWRGLTITVKEQTVQESDDRIKTAHRIAQAIYPHRDSKETPDDEWFPISDFTTFVFQTVAIKGTDYRLPSPTSPIDDLVQAFHASRNLPKSLFKQWGKAIDTVNDPDVEANSNDPELSSAVVKNEVNLKDESDGA